MCIRDRNGTAKNTGAGRTETGRAEKRNTYIKEKQKGSCKKSGLQKEQAGSES